MAGSKPMWRRVYRALEHRQAKKHCENVPPSLFPDEMRKFGQTFAALQSKRNSADYDPDYRGRKSQVTADIDNAREVIARFRSTSSSAKRDFAIHVLMKARAES